LEDRFNKNYLYPYVFLNDVPFDESFKTWGILPNIFVILNVPSVRQIKSLTNAPVQFGVVPNDQWNPPPWINESRATASRLDMAKNEVLYGGAITLIISDVP
jgi:alpha 1,2-mannosyltransferase